MSYFKDDLDIPDDALEKLIDDFDSRDSASSSMTQFFQNNSTQIDKHDARISFTQNPPNPPQYFSPISKDKLKLNYWIRNDAICKILNDQGIVDLHPWQAACLSENTGGNIIYNAPCSSGKSLVADIMMLNKITTHPGKALYIVPYVAIVTEKVKKMSDILLPLGFEISGHYENSGGGYIGQEKLAICTLEKAATLVHSLLNTSRISEICCVVVDEIHMMSDKSRGWLYEAILSKLLFVGKSIQIICLSGTLPNLDAMANWLDAQLFVTDYRPVPLIEMYKKRDEDFLYSENGKMKMIPYEKNVILDPYGIYPCATEITNQGLGVLIFCNSKQNVEETAKKLASMSGPSKDKQVQRSELARSTMNTELADIIMKGYGFHHAGLLQIERDAIQIGFAQGVIHTLCCTTTLAAGVNLPARRVIFNGIKVGIERIDFTRYKQASGRAGRKGLDSTGDSIVISRHKTDDVYILDHLLRGTYPAVKSQLEENLSKVLLDVIGNGLIQTDNDLNTFIECTYSKVSWKKAIEELLQSGMLEKKDVYKITQLGASTIMGTMNVTRSLKLLKEIKENKGMLACPVYICYFALFGDVDDRVVDYDIMRRIMEADMTPETSDFHGVLRILGIPTVYLSQFRTIEQETTDVTTRQLRRLYFALILQDVIREIPIDQIASKYRIYPGDVSSLQKSVCVEASSMSSFCERMGFGFYKVLFQELHDLLHFGVSSDLLELMHLSSLTAPKARALFKAGYQTIEAIARTSVDLLDLVIKNSQETKKIWQEARTSFDEAQPSSLTQLGTPSSTKVTPRSGLKRSLTQYSPNKKLKYETKPEPEFNADKITTFCFSLNIRDDLRDRHGSSTVDAPQQYVIQGISIRTSTGVIYHKYNSLTFMNDLKKLFNNKHPKYCYDWKKQYKALVSRGITMDDFVYDIGVANWLCSTRNEDSKEMSLKEICKENLPNPKTTTYDNPQNMEVEQVWQCWNSVFRDLLSQLKLTESFKRECQLIQVLGDMERYGVPIDIKLVDSLFDQVRSLREDVEKLIHAMEPNLMLTSKAKTAVILYDKRKLPPGPKTTSGQFTTNKEHLVTIQHLDPLVGLIMRWREINTVAENVDVIKTKIVSNRVYPTWKQFTSITGRINAFDPAIQTTRKDATIGDLKISLRRSFKAPNGYILFSLDYQSAELRMLAHFSKDPTLKKYLLDSSIDIFQHIAKTTFDKDVSDPEARNDAKKMIYGILYGMGDKRASKQMNISDTEMALHRKQFYNSFPCIKQYEDDIVESAKSRNCVYTILGRRRCLKNLQTDATRRSIMNSQIQGSVADLIKVAMIKIHKERFNSLMIMHNHDELIFQVATENIGEIKKIQYIMENAINLTIPFPVRVKIGQNWGEMKN